VKGRQHSLIQGSVVQLQADGPYAADHNVVSGPQRH